MATVARRAGACIVSASRALNANPLVARATRDRILAAQIELDYAPNLLARGLVQNRTATVDVAIHEDIALVSYDDIPYRCRRVPLTTVAVPKRSLGEKAANLLFQRYDGKGCAKPRQILLPPELVVRASCP